MDNGTATKANKLQKAKAKFPPFLVDINSFDFPNIANKHVVYSECGFVLVSYGVNRERERKKRTHKLIM